jgi:hypothetical protein
MIADYDFDRKDAEKVLDYLKKKYDLDHLQVMSLSVYSGIVSID